MSTTVEVKTPSGEADGSVDLPAEIFDVPANVPLLHQVVVGQMAAARQGTHSTKTRGEARGGGRKPYRQKGTGRARQGSIRAPQFTGGGVVHGPKPRDYTQRTPKKMKAAGLRQALSDRARSGKVHLVTELVSGEQPSTKSAKAAIAAVTDAAAVLLVLHRDEKLASLSARNLTNVHLITPDQLNTYDVLVNDDVVFTKAAYEEFLVSKQPAVGPGAPSAGGGHPGGDQEETAQDGGGPRMPETSRPDTNAPGQAAATDRATGSELESSAAVEKGSDEQ